MHIVCPATKEHPRRRETLNGIWIYRYAPGPEARRSAAYLLEYGIAIGAQLRIALGIRLRHRIAVVLFATRQTCCSWSRCRWSRWVPP